MSTLLHLQNKHRSENVTRGELDNLVTCKGRRGNWECFELSDYRVLDILRHSGFYGLYNSGTLRLDHHLITALVERWRQETHTFHLVTGEAIVTLEDIAVI